MTVKLGSDKCIAVFIWNKIGDLARSSAKLPQEESNLVQLGPKPCNVIFFKFLNALFRTLLNYIVIFLSTMMFSLKSDTVI